MVSAHTVNVGRTDVFADIAGWLRLDLRHAVQATYGTTLAAAALHRIAVLIQYLACALTLFPVVFLLAVAAVRP